MFRVLATKTIETSSNIIMLHEADYAGSSRIELLQRYNRRERKREGEKFVEMIEDTSTREISSCGDVRVRCLLLTPRLPVSREIPPLSHLSFPVSQ